jgi:ribosomal protein S18
MNPQFGCHLIDLDAISFVDVLTLRKFLSEDCEIMPRKATGLCAKCQRKVLVISSFYNYANCYIIHSLRRL